MCLSRGPPHARLKRSLRDVRDQEAQELSD
jgi:hypothetical protein